MLREDGQRRPSSGRTAKGEATRERILVAACDLVFERGVGELNLDEVRRVTNTSKSQLYHYFSDKTDLVHAIVTRQGERVLGVHRRQLEAVDGWDALRRWRDVVLALVSGSHCRGGCPVGSLANELAEIDEAARGELATVFERWHALLVEALAEMAARGELSEDADVDRLALATLATLQGGLLLTKTMRTIGPLEVALDAALAYLRGFAAPGAPAVAEQRRFMGQPSPSQ